MSQEEKYSNREHKTDNDNHLHLIRIRPRMLENGTSVNFPSPKVTKEKITPMTYKDCKPKLNRWKSAKDVDLSHMATGTHKIAFLTTNYDPNIDVDKEENDIKNLDFDFTRSLLTKSNLENVLQESPLIIHISTHGFHQYKAINKQTAFQIALEEPQTLRYLIDDHPKFSAIFAVIAILFEQEIHHFVQYGFNHKKNKINNKSNKIFKTWIWRDENRFALLCNKKIYKMLQCIADRYGCFCRENKIKNCVEIFWGKYKEISDNDLQFISVPHPPNILYTFSDIYKNDNQVQKILKNINDDYNKSVRQNIKIVKALRKYQKFSWEILSILMHQKLTYENIQLDEEDDTKWAKYKEINEISNNNIINEEFEDNNEEFDEEWGFGDDDDDEWGFGDDDDDDDNDKLIQTEIKFGQNQELTREILIDVSNQKEKLEAKRDAIKMQKLIKKLSRLKKKLIIKLYASPNIRIRWHFASTSSSNVHIIRFADEYSLLEAKKLIDYIRHEPEYSHEYDIKFSTISKSRPGTKKQVGYIAKTQEKIFSIDIENKTDPISQMLKKHLKHKRFCKIKLLILNGCHSFILGKIFSEYVENVICVHPFVKILDKTATTFTKFFYESLQHYTHPRIPFSHSVLKAYNVSKTNVAKECSNDFACASHSHGISSINHNMYIQQIKRRVDQFNTLHFNENWRSLQNHINDEQLFINYRQKMKLNGVIMENDNMNDLYDGKTLIILNINENDMNQLKNYLTHHSDINMLNINTLYQINEYFEELSVAYFKFKNNIERDLAKEILSQKQYDEELVFSDKILFGNKCGMDDGKDDNKYSDDDDDDDDDDFTDDNNTNLGWIYRTVPRCCCSPFYPHIVQDKLIFLQNGKIINRCIIGNISQIKNGLKKIKIRNMKSKSKRNILPSSTDIIRTHSAHEDIKNKYNDEKEEKKIDKKKNSFGNNLDVKKPKQNNFNNFNTKPKRKKTNFGNNFGSNNFGNNFNNFEEVKYKKKNSFLSSKNVFISQNDNNKNKFNENDDNKLNELGNYNNNKPKFKQHVNQNEYFDNAKFKLKSNNKKKNNFGNNFGNNFDNMNNTKTVRFKDVNRGGNYEFTEQISNISESSTISSITTNIFPLTSDNSNSNNEQLSLLLEYD